MATDLSNLLHVFILKPSLVSFCLPHQCQDVIETSYLIAKQIADDVDFHGYLFMEFGKGLIKKCRTSPDAFIQLALQLAQFRVGLSSQINNLINALLNHLPLIYLLCRTREDFVWRTSHRWLVCSEMDEQRQCAPAPLRLSHLSEPWRTLVQLWADHQTLSFHLNHSGVKCVLCISDSTKGHIVLCGTWSPRPRGHLSLCVNGLDFKPPVVQTRLKLRVMIMQI